MAPFPFRQKRASEDWTPDTFLFWMIFVPILAVAAIFFMYFIKSSSAQQMMVPEGLEQAVLLDRTFTARCFSSPLASRTIIDMDLFTDGQLALCYPSGKEAPALRLVLNAPDAKIQKSIATSSWELDLPPKKSEQYPIVLSFQGKTYPADLRVEQQRG